MENTAEARNITEGACTGSLPRPWTIAIHFLQATLYEHMNSSVAQKLPASEVTHTKSTLHTPAWPSACL